MLYRFAKGSIPLVGILLLGAVVWQPATATAGPLQEAVQNGKHLFMTATFGGNGRTCNSCHLGGGTTTGRLPDGTQIPSLSKAATIFPRYNPRRGSVLTLQQQVHNCVVGAIQGTPPAYDSTEMVDLVSYLTSLSQGKPIDMGGKAE